MKPAFLSGALVACVITSAACGHDLAPAERVSCDGSEGGSLAFIKRTAMPDLELAGRRVVGSALADGHLYFLLLRDNDPDTECALELSQVSLESVTVKMIAVSRPAVCKGAYGLAFDGADPITVVEADSDKQVVRLGRDGMPSQTVFSFDESSAIAGIALRDGRLWVHGAGFYHFAYPSGSERTASALVYSGGPTVGFASGGPYLYFARHPFEGNMTNYLLQADATEDRVSCSFHTEELKGVESRGVVSVAADGNEILLAVLNGLEPGTDLVTLRYEYPTE